MNYQKIEKVLRANGWVCIRIGGSHHQFINPSTKKLATVPYHGGNKDIAIGTLKSIEKQTGLSLR